MLNTDVFSTIQFYTQSCLHVASQDMSPVTHSLIGVNLQRFIRGGERFIHTSNVEGPQTDMERLMDGQEN